MRPRIPVDNLHCTAWGAAAVVAGHTLQSLVVVRVSPEEVDILESLVACREVSKCRLRGREAQRTDTRLVEDIPVAVVVRNLVEEEARTPEVGEVHSLEGDIVVVADSHVAAPGRGRRTCRRAMRRAVAWPRLTKPSFEARACRCTD